MKYHKLTSKIPIKKILDGYGYTEDIWNGYWNGSWHQFNEPDETIHPIVSKLLGIKLTDNTDCILHIGNDFVEIHHDNMSKRVYLIPLRFTKTMEFYEGWIARPFKQGYAIKFNDYFDHGISNEYCGKFIIMSVSL